MVESFGKQLYKENSEYLDKKEQGYIEMGVVDAPKVPQNNFDGPSPESVKQPRAELDQMRRLMEKIARGEKPDESEKMPPAGPSLHI